MDLVGVSRRGHRSRRHVPDRLPPLGCDGIHTIIARAGGRWIVRTPLTAEYELGKYERHHNAVEMCATLLARRAETTREELQETCEDDCMPDNYERATLEEVRRGLFGSPITDVAPAPPRVVVRGEGASPDPGDIPGEAYAKEFVARLFDAPSSHYDQPLNPERESPTWQLSQ